jgi:hypothetical protein
MMQPWYELMKTETEPIIFIYLLFLGPDYGYNISKIFQAAISDNIWDDTRGRQTLKNPNLVSATLKEMETNGLLFKREDKRRSYYTANIDVIRSPCVLGETNDQHVECEDIIFDVLNKGDTSLIIKTLQELEIDRSKFIKYLNSIKKFDYITILSVFNEIITRFVYFISADIHEATFHMTYQFSHQNNPEETIREELLQFYTIDPQAWAKIEMAIVNLEKKEFANKQKLYTEKLLDIGYNEENLNNFFKPLKIAALPVFRYMNLNETIVKIIYMERGIPTIPVKTHRLPPSVTNKPYKS